MSKSQKMEKNPAKKTFKEIEKPLSKSVSQKEQLGNPSNQKNNGPSDNGLEVLFKTMEKNLKVKVDAEIASEKKNKLKNVINMKQKLESDSDEDSKHIKKMIGSTKKDPEVQIPHPKNEKEKTYQKTNKPMAEIKRGGVQSFMKKEKSEMLKKELDMNDHLKIEKSKDKF